MRQSSWEFSWGEGGEALRVVRGCGEGEGWGLTG